jgi:Domain of unknown function (DUF4124)
MRALIVLISLALAGAAAQAQTVYKVIKPDGTVEYTDSPPPGEAATKVEVPPLNIAEPPPALPAGNPSPTDQAPGYTSLRITSPGDGAAIRDNAGNVNVDLALEPPLRSGDRIEILVDGRVVAGGNKTSITLANVERGSHSVQAVVKSPDGKVVTRSNSVSFDLQRRSAILQPAPPRPTPFGGGRAS